MLNRCIYQIYVGFNNGEVRTSSVFDPFNGEIHQANKLVDEAYIERHFAEVSYEQKVSMLRRLYEAVAFDSVFRGLPDHFKKIFSGYCKKWHPVTPEEIVKTISELASLATAPISSVPKITSDSSKRTFRKGSRPFSLPAMAWHTILFLYCSEGLDSDAIAS